MLISQLWDTRDGEFVRSLKGHTGEVLKLGYSKDELFLVSCGSECIIMVRSCLSNFS
jgi:WD40 repeat protein